MSAQQPKPSEKQGISKVKLAIGAASLFLFIVGIKRTFQMDEAQGGRTVSAEPPGGQPAQEGPSAGSVR